MVARDWIELILAAAIFVAPIAVLVQRTWAKTKNGASFGVGVRATQFLGAAVLPPALIILALERLIDGATVAALAGAFIGYLFSGLKEFDRRDPDESS